jgi:hypothetical protein
MQEPVRLFACALNGSAHLADLWIARVSRQRPGGNAHAVHDLRNMPTGHAVPLPNCRARLPMAYHAREDFKVPVFAGRRPTSIRFKPLAFLPFTLGCGVA